LVLSLFNFIKLDDKSKAQPIDLLLIIFPLALHGYLLAISLIINVQMRFILTFWPVIMLIFALVLVKTIELKKAQ